MLLRVSLRLCVHERRRRLRLVCGRGFDDLLAAAGADGKALILHGFKLSGEPWPNLDRLVVALGRSPAGLGGLASTSGFLRRLGRL